MSQLLELKSANGRKHYLLIQVSDFDLITLALKEFISRGEEDIKVEQAKKLLKDLLKPLQTGDNK